MFQTNVVEKIKTRILFSNFFGFKMFLCGGGGHANYEIMWKNMVDPERPGMTIYNGACALRAE